MESDAKIHLIILFYDFNGNGETDQYVLSNVKCFDDFEDLKIGGHSKLIDKCMMEQNRQTAVKKAPN